MDKGKIEAILQEFSELIEVDLEYVIDDKGKRPATLQDKIEFIQCSWLNASEDLYELGIETNY